MMQRLSHLSTEEINYIEGMDGLHGDTVEVSDDRDDERYAYGLGDLEVVGVAAATATAYCAENPEECEALKDAALDKGKAIVGDVVEMGKEWIGKLFGSGSGCDYDGTPNPVDYLPGGVKGFVYDKTSGFSSLAGFFEGEWNVVYSSGPVRGKSFKVRFYDREGFVVGPTIGGDVSSNMFIGKRTVTGFQNAAMAGNFYVNRCRFYSWTFAKTGPNTFRATALTADSEAVAERVKGPAFGAASLVRPKEAVAKKVAKAKADTTKRAKRSAVTGKVVGVDPPEMGGGYPTRPEFWEGWKKTKSAIRTLWPNVGSDLDAAGEAYKTNKRRGRELIDSAMKRIGPRNARDLARGEIAKLQRKYGTTKIVQAVMTDEAEEDRPRLVFPEKPYEEEPAEAGPSRLGLYLGIGGATLAVLGIGTAVVLSRR